MQDIAAKGRGGDDTIAHVGTGELMIPAALQTPELIALFSQIANQAGVDPARFVVGSGQNSTNPATGKFEFGLGPGGAGASGGQGNDGGAGEGGMGDGGQGGMGEGQGPGNQGGGYGPGSKSGGWANANGSQTSANGLGNDHRSSDPMVRAFQEKNYVPAAMFAVNKVLNKTPVGLFGSIANALGATHNANPDGSLGSFGGRTGTGDAEGGMSLAKRMLR